MSAFLELKDGRFVLGIWFLSDDAGASDAMIAAYRDGPDPGEWTLTWRFRYYVDDRVFNSDDVRSVYSARKTCAEAELLAAARTLVGVMALKYPRVDERLVRSASADVVLRAIERRSWCHSRVVKKGEQP